MTSVLKSIGKESSVFIILGLIFGTIGMILFTIKFPTLDSAKADASSYFMVFVICAGIYCILRGLKSMEDGEENK